jgi:F-type H+-transporting ATPase subunit alpha
LDEETQYLLNKGYRLTELLKQDRYSPLEVWQQVIVVYSGVGGYLDKLDVKDIQLYENVIFLYWLSNTVYAPLIKVYSTAELAPATDKTVLV